VGVRPRRRREPRALPPGERARRVRAIAIFAAITGGIALALVWPWSRDACEGAAVRRAADAGVEGGDALVVGVPESLTRDQVRDALGEVAPVVAACGVAGAEGDEVRVHLSIAGATGTVTEATVAKQYSGTPVADCAIGVVERAQFPRFRKKVLTVVYPFKLRPAPVDAGAAAPDAMPPDAG
jgi:hypothetical protein